MRHEDRLAWLQRAQGIGTARTDGDGGVSRERAELAVDERAVLAR
jgi:hypothetical protein